MNRPSRFAAASAAFVVLAAAWAPSASAAVSANVLRGPTIQYCFVGTAQADAPDTAKAIEDQFALWAQSGFIRWERLQSDGNCPKHTQTTRPDGSKLESNMGDVRISIDGTKDDDGNAITGTPPTQAQRDKDGNVIPGTGCPDKGGGHNWSQFPSNALDPDFKACRYTMHIDRGQALNKTMHEIGHSLGLIHEHERTDVPKDTDAMAKLCYDTVDYYGHKVSSGLLTPYDPHSVMHYEIDKVVDPTGVTSNCNLPGGDTFKTGPTFFDQLGMRIMYPHASHVAEYIGPTVIRAGNILRLRNYYGYWGAKLDQALKSAQWSYQNTSDNGATSGTVASPDWTQKLDKAGVYLVQYRYVDFMDRAFQTQFVVRVLSPADWNAMTASPAVLSVLN